MLLTLPEGVAVFLNVKLQTAQYNHPGEGKGGMREGGVRREGEKGERRKGEE